MNMSRPANISPISVIVLIATLAPVALLGIFVSPALGGCLYALVFIALTCFRPDLAFLVMFAAAPCMWDVGGGPVKLAISDISVVLALPILALRKLMISPRLASNPVRAPIWTYLGVCILSIIANQVPEGSLVSMLQMLVDLVVVAFVFSSCIEGPEQMRPAFWGLIVMDSIFSVVALMNRSDYIMGLHKNALGAVLSYGILIGTELWFAEASRRRSKMLLTILLCILSAALVQSLSRGAWLGTAVGLFFIMAVRRQFHLMFKVFVILLPVVFLCWMTLPAQSRQYAADFGADSPSTAARLNSIDFSWKHFQSSPVIGVGVGLRKMYDSTNLAMSTLAETGIVGLLSFVWIFFSFFRMILRGRRLLDNSDPLLSFLSIGAALTACSFVHGLVDFYWVRGMLPVWAAMGMAVFAFNRSQQSRHAKRCSTYAISRLCPPQRTLPYSGSVVRSN
ncbi:MAG TPA: O-antigen ligase family protein [Tepidisphaeraceae bacterium]|nr:O-antigen ligase family protein [Tepidisphaeraceae bacterium]